MPRPQSPSPVRISPAQVRATDTENRFLDIKYLDSDRVKKGVIPVMDFSNYSFPKVDDYVLILEGGERTYCLGKLDYQYADKINGVLQNDGSRTLIQDKTTGSKIKAKQVEEGQIYFGNFIKKIWLTLSPSGDFALLSAAGLEGLKYLFKDRLLKLSGMTVQILGNGARVAFGSVMRVLPGIGNQPIPSVENPLLPAVEGSIEILYATLKIARLAIGHVTDSLGIPELATIVPEAATARIRVILEAAIAGVQQATLKMDEFGNVAITSLAGKISLQPTLPLGSLLLGSNASPFSAVLGEQLMAWINTHTHSSGVGPTGIPIVPMPATTLSQKVKLDP